MKQVRRLLLRALCERGFVNIQHSLMQFLMLLAAKNIHKMSTMQGRKSPFYFLNGHIHLFLLFVFRMKCSHDELFVEEIA